MNIKDTFLNNHDEDMCYKIKYDFRVYPRINEEGERVKREFEAHWYNTGLPCKIKHYYKYYREKHPENKDFIWNRKVQIGTFQKVAQKAWIGKYEMIENEHFNEWSSESEDDNDPDFEEKKGENESQDDGSQQEFHDGGFQNEDDFAAVYDEGDNSESDNPPEEEYDFYKGFAFLDDG